MSRTNKELIQEANELARKIYIRQGYEVPKGYRFDQAHHPQEIDCWLLAVMAYNHIEGTDIENALAEEDA